MERRSDLPAGYDEEDPYDETDLEELDPWWRRNVDEFRSHEMRPYRPPRFRDGAVTPATIERLEAELDATIQFRVVDPQDGHDWEIRVDDERIATVERYRDEGGFSVYELDCEEFERLVRAHAADGRDGAENTP